jgi:hypothetical protein
MDAEAAGNGLEPGTKVDVRSRFDARWSHGFEVAESVTGGYRIRRLSDGALLPIDFPSSEVRPERKKRGTWWY